MLHKLCLACVLPLAAGQALANDSIAELGTGGLIVGRTDAVGLESEDLFISMERVEVDYVFRNQTDKDVETIVAFPMPDIVANPYTMPALPDDTADNFLDFEVSVAGRRVEPRLEQRAFAVGVEITDELKANGIPINPFTPPAIDALARLPDAVAAKWIERGIIFIDTYDAGGGWKDVRTPIWTLKSTYWWTSRFPAKAAVKVWHRYRPSLGASVGLNFFSEGKFQGSYEEYKHRFCMDETMERAVKKAAEAGPDGYPQLAEYRLQYVLTTGGNWALGSIGKFHLTVDKGDPGAIVSFCGEKVRKTGPTTFELEAENFYPQRDIDILILKPLEEIRGAGTAPGRRRSRPGPAQSEP